MKVMITQHGKNHVDISASLPPMKGLVKKVFTIKPERSGVVLTDHLSSFSLTYETFQQALEGAMDDIFNGLVRSKLAKAFYRDRCVVDSRITTSGPVIADVNSVEKLQTFLKPKGPDRWEHKAVMGFSQVLEQEKYGWELVCTEHSKILEDTCFYLKRKVAG